MQYLFSCLLAIFLVISFMYQENNQPTSKLEQHAWEHSIILDMKKSSDRKLAKTLELSTYTCQDLVIESFTECSIKNHGWSSQKRPKFPKRRLMTSISSQGDTLKIYQNNDGSAHLEVFNKTNGTHHLYSFTSTRNLERYSEVYQDEIFPENINSIPFNLF